MPTNRIALWGQIGAAPQTDTGSANAYAVAHGDTLYSGQIVIFEVAHTNTGASTLAVSGQTAKSIKRPDGSALSAGDLTTGQVAITIYDGTNFQLQTPVANASGGGGSGTWGSITGTLSSQTDLQSALDAKLDDTQLDTDGTLAANSDSKIASQKAAKTYVDTAVKLYGEFGITIDGGGATPSTGSKGFLSAKFAGTITEWELVGDQSSGSAQVTIKRGTPSSDTTMPSTSSIVASAPPVLSSQQRKRSATLTGWTTSFAVNDVFEFNLDSVTTHSRLTLIVRFQRT